MTEAKHRARDWTQIAIRREQHAVLKRLSKKSEYAIYIVLRKALLRLAAEWNVDVSDLLVDAEEEEVVTPT